ncbi:MAG: ChbG/HpnK family deacetylase [Patescibacteria group bacterium]
MKKIIVNVDDFGMSEVFNEVMLGLLEKDFIKSTSVLVLRGIEKQIAQIEKLKDLAEQKDISIGLHFELDEKENDSEKATRKIERQNELFIKYFRFKPSHIDKHKNIYSNEEAQAMINFAIKNNIYIRDCFSGYIYKNRDKIKTSDRVVFLAEKSVNDMGEIILNMQDNEVMEIIAHPGKFDRNCQSSLNKDREKDYNKILELVHFLKENNIAIIGQKDVCRR